MKSITVMNRPLGIVLIIAYMLFTTILPDLFHPTPLSLCFVALFSVAAIRLWLFREDGRILTLILMALTALLGLNAVLFAMGGRQGLLGLASMTLPAGFAFFYLRRSYIAARFQ